jgi:hypothetical protein
MYRICRAYVTDEKWARVLFRKHEGKIHFGDINVGGRIILKGI